MACVQVVEQLVLVFRHERAHSFEFQDNEVIHDDIGDELTYDVTIVMHREGLLASHPKALFAKLNGKGTLVDTLQEAVAECVVTV